MPRCSYPPTCARSFNLGVKGDLTLCLLSNTALQLVALKEQPDLAAAIACWYVFDEVALKEQGVQ